MVSEKKVFEELAKNCTKLPIIPREIGVAPHC